MAQKVTQIGHAMLLEAFQAHESVRDKILEEIVTRVITKADNVRNYFGLLSKISRSAPHSLLNALPKVHPTFGLVFTFVDICNRLKRQWSM